MKTLRFIRATGIIAFCVLVTGSQFSQYRDSCSQALSHLRNEILNSKTIELSVIDSTGDSSMVITRVKWDNLWWAIQEAGSNPMRKLKVCLKDKATSHRQRQTRERFSIID